MILKKCPNCGIDNDADSIVCKNCGTQFNNKEIKQNNKRKFGFVLAIVLVLAISSVVAVSIFNWNLEPDLKEINFVNFTIGVSADTNLANGSSVGAFQIFSDNKTKTMVMFTKNLAISKSGDEVNKLFSSNNGLKKINMAIDSDADQVQFYNWTNNKEGYKYLATYVKDDILIIVATDNVSYLKNMVSSINVTNGFVNTGGNNVAIFENALSSGGNASSGSSRSSSSPSASSSLSSPSSSSSLPISDSSSGSELSSELFSSDSDSQLLQDFLDYNYVGVDTGGGGSISQPQSYSYSDYSNYDSGDGSGSVESSFSYSQNFFSSDSSSNFWL